MKDTLEYINVEGASCPSNREIKILLKILYNILM